MYFFPQIDDLNDNSIYINPGTNDASDLYTTMAHEGYPDICIKQPTLSTLNQI